MKIHQNNALGEIGSALGRGLLAGISATAVMTISQMIEMKITKREPSDAPVKVAEDTVGVEPATKADTEKLSQELHWAYGTSWGIARGLIGLTGLKGLPATLVHFTAVWGTSLIMLPMHKAAKPITKQKPQDIAVDAFHHAVYAITAGVVYDVIDAGSKNERAINRAVKRFERFINKHR